MAAPEHRPPAVSALLADPDCERAAALARRLGEQQIVLAGTVHDAAATVAALARQRPSALLLAADLVRQHPALLADLAADQNLRLVLLTADPADPLITESLGFGVQPLLYDAPAAALARAVRAGAVSQTAPGAEKQGQVIVVHGPAGGVGKTLLSLYLSYLFATAGHQSVLVDLNQYGAVAPWLRLPRSPAGLHTLVHALKHEGGAAGLGPALLPAPGAERRLLLALSSGPAKMDQLSHQDMQLLLGHLAGIARAVVVDTGSELTERVLGALLSAHRALLVLSPQIVTGWQALELLDVLRSAYVPQGSLGLVLNRVHRAQRFGLDEYRQALGLPLLATLPEAPVLRKLAERGGPPNLRRPRAVVGPARRLVRRLLAEREVPAWR